MTRNLKDFHTKYEAIHQSSLSDDQKSRKYADLMTEMEQEYKIPMLRNEAWEQENRKVIALYRKISMSRNL